MYTNLWLEKRWTVFYGRVLIRYMYVGMCVYYIYIYIGSHSEVIYFLKNTVRGIPPPSVRRKSLSLSFSLCSLKPKVDVTSLCQVYLKRTRFRNRWYICRYTYVGVYYYSHWRNSTSPTLLSFPFTLLCKKRLLLNLKEKRKMLKEEEKRKGKTFKSLFSFLLFYFFIKFFGFQKLSNRR